MPQEKWSIPRIAASARKNIEALEDSRLETILNRLEALRLNPYLGHDIKKVQGKEDIYRIRFGEFRLYYRLISARKEIDILLFEYRGKIKKTGIKRLKQRA
ncbi:MAG: hypothetical protein FJY83_01470 [Candidatus Aminicenantes bacterium]|nr:hypothetical protein [Candidatus Aminicenantes bacterium]